MLISLLSLANLLISWLFLNISTFLLLGWLLLQHTEKRKSNLSTPKKFKFILNTATWSAKSKTLSSTGVPDSVLESAPVVSKLLREFTDTIISNFIDGWYSSISRNTLFQDSIRTELIVVFRNLHVRLMKVDIARLMVLDIIPVLTAHYLEFISLSASHDPSYSIESKLAMAQHFNGGKLHAGVSLVLPSASKHNERAHFRQRMKGILPLLLSERERDNHLVLLLLQEILGCTVLTNAFDALSEGDFYNQTIVKLIGANLKHRSQVQRLRAALQEHSQGDFSALPTQLNLLTISRWMSFIDHASESDLRKAKLSLDSQVTVNVNGLEKTRELFSKVKERLYRRIQVLSQLDNKMPLEVILSQDEYAAVFREFLKGSGHDGYLNLWKSIELMKAPLEDSRIKNVTLQLEFSTGDDIKKIYTKYFNEPGIVIDDKVRQVIDEYIQSPNANLYQNARDALFKLQEDLFYKLKKLFYPEFRVSERYGDLDTAAPKQNRRVASTAFPTIRLLNQNKLETRAQVAYGDNENLESDSAISPAVMKAVESAFEKIMENSPSHTDLSQQEMKRIFHSQTNLTVMESSAKRYEIPSSGSLFGDNSKVQPKFDSSNRLSAMFENNSDVETDSDSVSSGCLNTSAQMSESQVSDFSNLEVLLAGPGDLSLAEQIGVLDNDIKNLSEQSEILLSLIKKAELTNNLGELKILRRSNASLEREINSKELQKQQYIVQENENSLYGKSKVQIQSCVFGSDENLPYVLYVIEVQKYSSENPDQIVAGWVVARRFSQFHKLNQYLKRRYASVRELKFPKKSVPYLKFKMSQQTEMRRPVLENYLQELLNLPEVCSDSAFRTFLSSETFGFAGSNPKSKRDLDAVLNKFYLAVGVNINKESQETKIDKSNRHEKILQNIKDMERELKQFDEMEKAMTNESNNVPFVKPISDLLLAVFDLGRNSWLRGRALLVILQQVLGSTIEKTIQQMVENNVKNEDKVGEILVSAMIMLFPNGKFRESPELRTKLEQAISRKEAYTLLQVFMDETCSKIFGSRNTLLACNNLLEMIQNDYLNKHLILKVMDIVFDAVFPELAR